MFKPLALALTLLAFGASSVMAHGPTRQKVTETIEINAPADKVWEVVGNFQDMSWHPAVTATEGEGGNDVNAKRTLTLDGGGKIFEALTKYNAETRLFAYEITEVDVKVLPVNNYSSSISVEDQDGKSLVTWKGAFYRGFMNNDPPEDLSDEAAVNAVTGVYKAGLEALKKKFEGGS